MEIFLESSAKKQVRNSCAKGNQAAAARDKIFCVFGKLDSVCVPGYSIEPTSSNKRALAQQGNTPLEQDEACGLTVAQRERLYNAAQRRWVLNEDALNEITDDLQIVVACTFEGDAILVNTRRTVQPPRTIVITKPLLLSAFSRNLISANGRISDTAEKISVTCPSSTQGVFQLRHPNVTIANLVIEDCDLQDGSPVIFVPCDDSSTFGTIQLQHMRFKNNSSPSNASVLFSSAGTCASLELVNSVLRRNVCGVQGCVLLPSRSSLSDLRISQNRRALEVDRETAVFVASGADINATNIQASNNACGSFSVTNSSLSVSQSRFSKTAITSSSDLQTPQGGVITTSRSRVDIEDCVFAENFAERGGAVFCRSSILTIRSTSFERNEADLGGALHLVLRSTLVVTGSSFTGNQGGTGSSIRVEDSSLQLSRTIVEDNRSLVLGAIHAQSSSGRIRNCTFLNNLSSERAGGLSLGQSTLDLDRVRFLSNGARDLGGSFFARSSTVQIRSSLFWNNSALVGGGIYSENTTLLALAVLFEGNRASEAGGAMTLSRCLGTELNNCRFLNNSCLQYGGGVRCYDTSISMHNCTFEANSAEQGGAHSSDASDVVMTDAIFQNNFASLRGGSMSLVRNTNLTIFNSTFLSETSAEGGSCYLHRSSLNGIGVAYNRSRGSIISTLSSYRSNITLQWSSMYGSSSPQYSIYAEGCNVVLSNMRATENEGEPLGFFSSNGTISDCVFDQNAGSHGGVFQIHGGHVTIARCVFLGNGGGPTGGAIYLLLPGHLKIQGSQFFNNSATDSGGCIRAVAGSELTITNSSFNMCQTLNGRAGAISCERCIFNGEQLQFISNTATANAGAVYVDNDAPARFMNCTFLNNSCTRYGGALYASRSSNLTMVNTLFQDNIARMNGGGVYIEQSRITLGGSAFINNTGVNGGGIYIERTSATITQTRFEQCSAENEGGGIYLQDASNVVATRCSFFGNTALSGGAIFLLRSDLNGSASTFQGNNAINGGAVYIDVSSTFYFRTFIFKRNRAVEDGGAIYCRTDDTVEIVCQMKDSSFEGNEAQFGGAFHSQRTQKHSENCTLPSSICSGVAILNTSFLDNKAAFSGAAIQVNSIAATRVQCGNVSSNEFLSKSQLLQLPSVRSLHNCSNWRGNQVVHNTGALGTVGSYARRVNVSFASQEGETSDQIEEGLTIRNVKSGELLPEINLISVDEFGTGPAFVSRGILQATMTSPDGFIPGEIPIPLENGTGSFTNVAGFNCPGNYHLRIHFNNADVEEVEIQVQIRNCAIGEHQTSNCILCQTCDSLSYNFEPNNQDGCSPCPRHGDCSGRFIIPNLGYWHSSPCSHRLRKCLNEEACRFDNRTESLNDITRSLESCNLAQTHAENYGDQQCRTGYTGLLCGACAKSYGRYGLLTCGKCLHSALSIVFIFLTALWLLLITATVIRGSLPCKNSRNSRQRSETAQQRAEMIAGPSVPVNFEMVELMIRGRLEPDIKETRTQHSVPTATTNTAPQVEITKRLATESFKITVNYLQVLAVAATVNVVWTDAVATLITIAENVGGITTESVTGSVDCILSSDTLGNRSLLGLMISLFVPVAVCAVLALFWSVYTIFIKEGLLYLAKRCVLSVVVVVYISYIGITKLAVKVFYCVNVHDSTEYESFSSAVNYWAMDTSLKCYEGPHNWMIVLASFSLLLVTIAFPLVSAFVSVRLVQQRLGSHREWILEIMGFIYKAFDEKFVYWESVIMARKATLSIVAVFSYPLGGNIQSIFASLILIVALFLQTTFRPYKKEVSVLNSYEAVSLFVSLITFTTGQFFEQHLSEGYVRILLSVALLLLNVGFFTFMFVVSMRYGLKHMRVALEDEQVLIPPNAKWWTIARLYVGSKWHCCNFGDLAMSGDQTA